MAKISKEEYELLKSLGDQREWMARDLVGDHGGDLFAYPEKPFKNHDTGGWVYGRWFHPIDNHLFQFIKWEDREPCSVAELIEEYESEETEYPKIIQEEYEHINWLLKRVKKEIKRKDENLGLLDWNSRQANRLSGQIEAFEHIEMLINEIGKPSYFRNKNRESGLNGEN